MYDQQPRNVAQDQQPHTMAAQIPNGTEYGDVLNTRTDGTNSIHSYNFPHVVLQPNARDDGPLTMTANSPQLSDSSTQAMRGHERLYDISTEVAQTSSDLLGHPHILDPSMRAEMGHYWVLDPSTYALHAPFDSCTLPPDVCMSMTPLQHPCTPEEMHNSAQNVPTRPIFSY